MKIGSIHRYPVKSMGGETLDEVHLGMQGIHGDRAWAVRDEVSGGIRGAKKIPALMSLSARYEQPPGDRGSSPAVITLPDGTEMGTGDPTIGKVVSAAVDREISLWPLLPADALDHYRRGDPDHDDLKTELRAIFGRTEDEPLPDLSLFPPELIEYESPPGTYFDAYPLSLLTDRTLETMAARAPDSVFDRRRFRPNLLVTGVESPDPFPELAWCGHQLKVGEAVLRVTIAAPRCVMITHGFDELPKDPSIMRAVVQEAGGNLGVYATVESPGTVRAGDAIQVLKGQEARTQPAWLRKSIFTIRATMAMIRAVRRKKREAGKRV